MTASGRYSRIYWEAVDDVKFATVWDDDRALAAWLRLLIVADMSWPSSAPIPIGTNAKALEKLESVRLIERMTGSRFRVVGLDAERTRRADAARTGADARWRTGSNAESMQSHSVSNADGMLVKQSRVEKEKSIGADASDPLDIYYRAVGSWPGPKVAPWIEDLSSSYGVDRFAAALGAELASDEPRHTLMSRVRDCLQRERYLREREAETIRSAREAEERARIEEMPEEQRAANIERLLDMMKSAGLAGDGGEVS